MLSQDAEMMREQALLHREVTSQFSNMDITCEKFSQDC